jgi:hypothetical protein
MSCDRSYVLHKSTIAWYRSSYICVWWMGCACCIWSRGWCARVEIGCRLPVLGLWEGTCTHVYCVDNLVWGYVYMRICRNYNGFKQGRRRWRKLTILANRFTLISQDHSLDNRPLKILPCMLVRRKCSQSSPTRQRGPGTPDPANTTARKLWNSLFFLDPPNTHFEPQKCRSPAHWNPRFICGCRAKKKKRGFHPQSGSAPAMLKDARSPARIFLELGNVPRKKREVWGRLARAWGFDFNDRLACSASLIMRARTACWYCYEWVGICAAEMR